LPLVEFQAGDQTITSLVSAPARGEGWPLGSAVDVLYDSADPHHARLADTRFPIARSTILGLAIVVLFLAAVGLT
jgi:hypothetical protein